MYSLREVLVCCALHLADDRVAAPDEVLEKKSLWLSQGERGPLELLRIVLIERCRAGAASITLTARTESELDKVQSDVTALKLDHPPKVIKHITDVTSSDSVTGLFDHLDKEGIYIDGEFHNEDF